MKEWNKKWKLLQGLDLGGDEGMKKKMETTIRFRV